MGVTPAAQITGGKLATWVRKLGISDPDVFPNHGWRHKFKTDARPLMQEIYIDAIQGARANDAGRKYGEFPVLRLASEIAKIPRQTVDVPMSGGTSPALKVRKSRAIS